jgi:transcriptional regulator with XRE-family HTH domain
MSEAAAMPKGKPPTPEQIALGDAIRAARERQDISQERLALTAGIDRSYYSAVERGEFNLTLNALLKIAAALNTPAWQLLRQAEL